MKREIIQLHKIGKELGITKKEIDKVFFYDNFWGKHIGGIMLILILLFVVFLIILSSLYLPPYIPKDNTYKTGTLYSTVRIKDFNKRKLIQQFFLK